MDTPIYDFLAGYAASDTLRCHMPGHKGHAPLPQLEALYALDITEIKGADSLFEADGIIAQSERNMSALYGTAETVYSAGGSTLCIQTMLAIMKSEGRRVLAVRNVHRAFLNAAALLGIDAEWIMPDYTDGILSGSLDPRAVERTLSECGVPSCLYVTSPDYTGRTADIRTLAKICERYDSRLIVDNAHGAHLAFMPENMHPIALGADMCCDSAHKMLPALTGAAMLHANSRYSGLLKRYMSIFASTSPSYLIMTSLDLCNKYISKQIRADISGNMKLLAGLRERFSSELVFADGEPFHITIRASESGLDGNVLAELLRENGAECEYADSELVILLMSPVNTGEDYQRLADALESSLRGAGKSVGTKAVPRLSLPKRAMSIREAVFAECEEIPVTLAEGRVCGAVNVPCPPAVPIAVSGEVIDRSCIDVFKAYGIETVNVVKD